MKLVDVTLKNGSNIRVYDHEVKVLKNAGKLKEDKQPAKVKEEKDTGETKEEKSAGETKGDQKTAMERMHPSKKRPVDIGKSNIKGSK